MKISSANSVPVLQPLCSLKASHFILSVLDEKFVLFDPKDGTYKDYVIDGFQDDLTDYTVEGFAESLISTYSRTNFLTSEGLNNSLI